MTAAERAPTLDGLKPYPAYKDSGVEWIGDIPQGWTPLPLKQVLSQIIMGGTPSTDVEAYWDDNGIRWVTIADMTRQPHLKTTVKGLSRLGLDSKKLQVLPVGTVLYSIYASLGKVAVLQVPAVTNQAILALLPTEDVAPDFLRYWLNGIEPHVIASANTNTQNNLNQSKVRNLPFAKPSELEQQQIAAFLDHETARIDALVREQELLLEDLAEKRQATINHATLAATPVSNAQLPAGWRSATLKTLLTSFEQGWSPQCDNRPATEGEWGVMKVGCVNGHTFNPEENKALPADLDPIRRYALKYNDVLISRANTRDLVGSAARVDQDYPNLLLCDKLYRLRTDEAQLRPAYLVLLLNSPIARAAIETSASGASASMVNISQSTIRNLVFPIPPANEQDNIITHLDERLAQIDALVLEVRANIEDMKLLRSTLITAATTGKIDVRDWRPA